jgi:hypothetical protein
MHVSLVIALIPLPSYMLLLAGPLLAESIQSVDTVYSADSIEFSPVQHDIFVCGTYQIEKLDEATGKVDKEVSGKSEDNENGDSDNEDSSSGPKTRRLGRALVYQVAEDGQSLCVSDEGTLSPSETGR